MPIEIDKKKRIWEEKKEKIRKKILMLQYEHEISQKEISENSKWGHNATTLNRFLNNSDFKIADERISLIKLDNYCDEIIYSSISRAVDGIHHPLYYALLKELRITEGSQKFLKSNVIGTYKFYVGSFLLPIKFPGIVLGYMNVQLKDDCVFVEEFQKYDGAYGAKEKIEENVGYMIRKSNKFYIMSTQKGVENREDLKLTVFHKKIPSKTIEHLEGVVFGVSHDDGIFNSRIVMERIGGSSLFEKEKHKSRIISIEEIESEKTNSKYEHYLFYEFIRKERTRDDLLLLIW